MGIDRSSYRGNAVGRIVERFLPLAKVPEAPKINQLADLAGNTGCLFVVNR